MKLGYNTNGFACHRIEDAIEIIAEIGYRSVALTLERSFFDPPDRRGAAQAIARFRPLLRDAGLAITIETGSRFILDPRRKHQPTLLSESLPDRRARIEFLKGAVECAAALDAQSVSVWSGAASPQAAEEWAMDSLVDGLVEVLDFARPFGVRLSFEPEPGMFIDTMARFASICKRLHSEAFGLTLDIGHVHCLGDGSAPDHIQQWHTKLWNVHLADMRKGIHEHLLFGEGEIEFSSVFAALLAIDYPGPVHVELSRHSHDAVETARRSFELLRRFL